MNWFKNLKISKKMIVGFLFVALIAAIVGVVGIINIVSLSRSTSDMYQNEALGIQYSGAAAANFMQLRYYLLKSTTLAEQQDIQENDAFIDEFGKSTDDDLNSLHNVIFDDPNILSLINDINSNWDDYKSDMEKLDGFTKANQLKDANYLITTTMAPTGNKLRDDLVNLMQLASDGAAATAKIDTENAQSSMILMIVILVIGIGLSLLLGASTAQVIGRPIRKMASVGKLLAKGDIDVDTVMNGKDRQLKQQKDEIGELAVAFDELIATTRTQVDAMQKLSDGDLTIRFDLASDKDLLGKSLIALTENLNTLMGSIRTAAE